MIGNMRTETKNQGLNIGCKLLFFLCALTSCFNQVATDETRYSQSGIETCELLGNEDDSGTFQFKLDINVRGKEKELIGNDYLKVSFEQIVKDYINNYIKCENESKGTSTTFTSMKIDESITSKTKLAIAGSGKCIGRRKNCFKFIKQTKPKKQGRLKSINSNSTNNGKDLVCENFRESEIFESFKNVTISASFYNYFVDVKIVRDTVENLDLNLIERYEGVDDNALGDIDDVGVSYDCDTVKKRDTICDDECTQQKETMLEIFSHFNIPIVEDQHVCAYEGINCNDDERVTQIWMGK